MSNPKHITVRVYLPSEDFKRQFQAACALEGRKMSDVLLELMEDWLAQRAGSDDKSTGKREEGQ
ncbi:plasmid partition protein ParG [Allocoleopsis franciscana]|uniref:plasmid partition protein ParG n=1 Tax=Allocoleopsis franciscana TaxID=2886352 RepID=UPI0002FA7B31|nr:plasmid partition protein ParG [Allocoleopsis franciscana]